MWAFPATFDIRGGHLLGDSCALLFSDNLFVPWVGRCPRKCYNVKATGVKFALWWSLLDINGTWCLITYSRIQCILLGQNQTIHLFGLSNGAKNTEKIQACFQVAKFYNNQNDRCLLTNGQKNSRKGGKNRGTTHRELSCQVIYSQFGLAIHQNDHQARRKFVEWAQNEIAVVPDFHKRILFSDEAHFWLNGCVNKQNCRIWSEANPQVYVETPLHPEKLTVWCALWAGGILLQKR
ncbi:hypothetical protein TNCV_860281 [Trichonephila clavipes]|nr:hypothetical protein TNCV_860281 [Trichonephila clavipes]